MGGGVEDGIKEIDKINGRICKQILGILRFAAYGVTELKMGRDSRRGGDEHIGEIFAKDFTDEQGRFIKSVLRLANK
jgi:hypothetical protein